MTTAELIAALEPLIESHSEFEAKHAKLKAQSELYAEELRRRESPGRMNLASFSTAAIAEALRDARVDEARVHSCWGQVGEEMRELGGLTPKTKLRVLRDPRSEGPHESQRVLGGVIPEDWG